MTSLPPRAAVLDGLLDVLPDAVLLVDDDGRVAYANAAVSALLGHAPAALVGRSLAALLPPSPGDRAGAASMLRPQALDPNRLGQRPTLQALHRDGHRVPVSVSRGRWTPDGGLPLSVVVLHDVSALHSRLDQATALAHTDLLTGLGNRLRLSQWMQPRLDGQRPFGLLLLDLRQFKRLNDTHGHAAGDHALAMVARRLRHQAREADLIVRWGGDEFVAALDAIDDAADLAKRALRVAAALRRPLSLGDAGIEVQANVGGALYPRHGTSEAALLAAADRAMYAAKHAGLDYALAPATREPPARTALALPAPAGWPAPSAAG